MTESTDVPRTTEGGQTLEKRSLLGSAYSYKNVAEMSAQTTSELADNGED